MSSSHPMMQPIPDLPVIRKSAMDSAACCKAWYPRWREPTLHAWQANKSVLGRLVTDTFHAAYCRLPHENVTSIDRWKTCVCPPGFTTQEYTFSDRIIPSIEQPGVLLHNQAAQYVICGTPETQQSTISRIAIDDSAKKAKGVVASVGFSKLAGASTSQPRNQHGGYSDWSAYGGRRAGAPVNVHCEHTNYDQTPFRSSLWYAKNMTLSLFEHDFKLKMSRLISRAVGPGVINLMTRREAHDVLYFCVVTGFQIARLEGSTSTWRAYGRHLKLRAASDELDKAETELESKSTNPDKVTSILDLYESDRDLNERTAGMYIGNYYNLDRFYYQDVYKNLNE